MPTRFYYAVDTFEWLSYAYKSQGSHIIIILLITKPLSSELKQMFKHN
jgi:hypothetical protein